MDTMWTGSFGGSLGPRSTCSKTPCAPVPTSFGPLACGDDPGQRSEFSEFWYIAYHTLFWLDLYLSGSVEGFAPPAPFTLDELDPAGLLPDRRYTRDELLAYLDHDRQKCQTTIETLTDDRARQSLQIPLG